jgi:anti-sigma factor (TIGR02949 family)
MTSNSDKLKNVDSDCLQAFDHLYAYINGELKDPKAVEMIEHHLDHCRSCFSRAQIEREINARLKTASTDGAPASLQDRLKKLIDNF